MKTPTPTGGQASEEICPHCGIRMTLVTDPTGEREYYHCFPCSTPTPTGGQALEIVPELLPCPFCGDGPVETTGTQVPNFDRTGFKFAGYCNDCFAEGPLAETELEAIKLWNMRAVHAENAALRDEVKASRHTSDVMKRERDENLERLTHWKSKAEAQDTELARLREENEELSGKATAYHDAQAKLAHDISRAGRKIGELETELDTIRATNAGLASKMRVALIAGLQCAEMCKLNTTFHERVMNEALAALEAAKGGK